MNRIFYFLVVLFLTSSCNVELERALKSTDTDKILKTADKFVEKKKYQHAVSLYERLVPFVSGTDLAADVAYKTAEANFKLKNYTLAGHQFKNFHSGFIKDSRSQDALYKAAVCYYNGSTDYNLDQTNTQNAITEMQNFINTYPDSERVKECNLMIKELHQKLELKAFENAKTLFRTMKYKSAVVAFGNVMNDFPDSSLREDVYYYNMVSKYELAKNSIFNLKKERIQETETSIKLLLKEFPETKYLSEINLLKNKITGLWRDFENQAKQIEEQKKSTL